MEDQPVEIVGEIAKREIRFSACYADGADEQPEPVLLMGKDVFDMGADRGLGSVGPSRCFRHGLALGFAPMDARREHAIRQPLLVTLRAIGTVGPDVGTGVAAADDLPEKRPSAADAEFTAISRMKPKCRSMLMCDL